MDVLSFRVADDDRQIPNVERRIGCGYSASCRFRRGFRDEDDLGSASAPRGSGGRTLSLGRVGLILRAAMRIPITCPGCSFQFDVPDKLVGRRAKCPSCGDGIAIKAAPARRASSGRRSSKGSESGSHSWIVGGAIAGMIVIGIVAYRAGQSTSSPAAPPAVADTAVPQPFAPVSTPPAVAPAGAEAVSEPATPADVA
jgi:hypothetical protein